MQPALDVEVHALWALSRVGHTLVFCARGDDHATDADVDAWMIRVARGDCTGILLHVRGGTPDARQRARLAEFWDDLPAPRPRFAMLTDSALVRAVATALGWISQLRVQSFAADNLAGALTYLEEATPIERVREVIAALDRALDQRATEGPGAGGADVRRA